MGNAPEPRGKGKETAIERRITEEKAMNCDLITLQYTEDSLRDRKKGSEKEMQSKKVDDAEESRSTPPSVGSKEQRTQKDPNGTRKGSEKEVRRRS